MGNYFFDIQYVVRTPFEICNFLKNYTRRKHYKKKIYLHSWATWLLASSASLAPGHRPDVPGLHLNYTIFVIIVTITMLY